MCLEVDAVDVVDEAHFVGERLAVGRNSESCERVCDEVVESGDSIVELFHSALEVGELSIEIRVVSKQIV